MDRGAWQATVLGIAKSQTRLSTNTHTHTYSGHTLAKLSVLSGLKGKDYSDLLFPSCCRGAEALLHPHTRNPPPSRDWGGVGTDPRTAPAWGIRIGTTEVRMDSVP